MALQDDTYDNGDDEYNLPGWPYRPPLYNGPLFRSGQLVITMAAGQALREATVPQSELQKHHLGGDWGHVDEERWRANDAALANRQTVVSEYRLPTRDIIQVVTPDHRGITVLMLPGELPHLL
jgi:hypothetical protein